MGGGICLFMQGQQTYDTLLRKEDEYTKQALEMSAYPPAEQMSYPPVYDVSYGPGNTYPAPIYEEEKYAPGGRVPESYGPPSNGSRPSSYEKDPGYSKMSAAPVNGSRPSRDERPYEEIALTTKAPYQGRSFDQRPTSYDSDQ